MSDEINDDQRGMLEGILRNQAIDHFDKANHYRHGFKPYFKACIQDVVKDYRNPRMVEKTVYDFACDRYIFYRRHKELDHSEATYEAFLDTFDYLVHLKNDFPLNDRPAMRDDWKPQ